MYQKSMSAQIRLKIFRISHVLIASQDDYLRLIQTPIPPLRYFALKSELINDNSCTRS
jgi:hypothetical protein